MTIAVPLAETMPRPATAMRTERDRFVALAFCWAELLVELDADAIVVFAAGAAESLLGWPPSALAGRSFASIVAADDQALADEILEIARRRGRIERLTLRLVHREGETISLAVAGHRLDDLDGHFFFAFRRAPAWPEAAAARDGETGLLQAESFVEAVTAGDGGDVLAPGRRMTFLGAEGYRDLRDRLDGPTERNLEIEIGTLLKAHSVGGDAAMRLTTDRFGLLHDADLDLDRLRQAVETLFRSADPAGRGIVLQAATVDIDAGIAGTADVAKGLVFVINRFRSATGDAFSLAGLSNSLSALVTETVAAVHAFKAIVADSRFSVLFQPIVDVVSGAIHHYEALARFDGAAGEQSPFQQILFAEETGLIVDFDLAMARKVIEWLATTPRNAKTVIAVNISGHSVGCEGFSPALHRLLGEHPWTRGRLMFEITESARMPRLSAANAFIQRLRREGYPVCLDDFGAGAANFQYLARLEVDTVKLDGEALRSARAAPKGQAFLRALVNLCRDLGVSTIAEMIEDESDIAFVRRCGVRYVQGHLLGRPSADIGAAARSIPKHLFGERGPA